MSETLFAFLALAIASLFAMSQMRASVEAEREVASIELEVLANAVGSETMQFLSTLSFDARTADGTVNPQNLDVSGLTRSSEFGDGLDCTIPGTCEDLDDFNNMRPDTLFFEVDIDDEGESIGFNFAVTALVSYIDETTGVETADRTWTKEVTLFIDQAVASSETKYLLRPVEIKRQFSPQWR